MTIEKGGKEYAVRENKRSWTVTLTSKCITISVNAPKAEYPTFESLKAFVEKDKMF